MQIQDSFRKTTRTPSRWVRGLTLAAFLFLSGFSVPAFGETKDDVIYFVQFSDTHWGFSNPKINPDFTGTLKKGITQANELPGTPDFIVFTGDETHTTGDAAVRQKRMLEFKTQVADLKVQNIKYLPGEHDVSMDQGQSYKKFFGDLYYAFDLKGVHFIALDNVSNPDGSLGDGQLAWLASVLNTFNTKDQVILFAHRPLVDVYAPWDWRTKDGAKALELLKPFKNVNLFYGHIHQNRDDSVDGFSQHAAMGMMFPLPVPGSTATPNQVAWDPDHPYRGLGFRTVKIDLGTKSLSVEEHPIQAQTTGADADMK
jgi:3',5'-cyclic AMP phosphodiesterase CpdA